MPRRGRGSCLASAVGGSRLGARSPICPRHRRARHRRGIGDLGAAAGRASGGLRFPRGHASDGRARAARAALVRPEPAAAPRRPCRRALARRLPRRRRRPDADLRAPVAERRRQRLRRPGDLAADRNHRHRRTSDQRLPAELGRRRAVGRHRLAAARLRPPLRAARRAAGRGRRRRGERRRRRPAVPHPAAHGPAQRARGRGDADRRRDPVREPRRQPRHAGVRRPPTLAGRLRPRARRRRETLLRALQRRVRLDGVHSPPAARGALRRVPSQRPEPHRGPRRPARVRRHRGVRQRRRAPLRRALSERRVHVQRLVDARHQPPVGRLLGLVGAGRRHRPRRARPREPHAPAPPGRGLRRRGARRDAAGGGRRRREPRTRSSGRRPRPCCIRPPSTAWG